MERRFGGQQQRVALARALVLEPEVLPFDEPLSNLDARLRRAMREEIRTLQQRLALTMAYVTHDLSEALAVSDQIIVMDQGVIAQCGTPQELYEYPQPANSRALRHALSGRIQICYIIHSIIYIQDVGKSHFLLWISAATALIHALVATSLPAWASVH